MIMDTAFRLFNQKYLGEGRGYGELISDLMRKLLSRNTYKGYKWFIGKGIFHVPSSSTKCCNALLKDQEDLRLVKVKGFKWEGKAAKAYLYINKGKYLEYKITHFNRTLYDLKPKIIVTEGEL